MGAWETKWGPKANMLILYQLLKENLAPFGDEVGAKRDQVGDEAGPRRDQLGPSGDVGTKLDQVESNWDEVGPKWDQVGTQWD